MRGAGHGDHLARSGRGPRVENSGDVEDAGIGQHLGRADAPSGAGGQLGRDASQIQRVATEIDQRVLDTETIDPRHRRHGVGHHPLALGARRATTARTSPRRGGQTLAVDLSADVEG